MKKNKQAITKRIIGLITAMLTMSIAAPALTQEQTQTGNSADNPITISNQIELEAFRDAVNGGNTYEGNTVTLTADIALTDTWTAIGNMNYMFNGTFDGGGYCISGLNVSINSVSFQNGGLFHSIGENAIVKNLGVTGRTISVTADDAHAGGITGYNTGTIQNCYTDITVTATGGMSTSAGGIAAINQGTISDCYTVGNSTATMYAGGIAGENRKSIKQCYATGAVSGNNAGGITGANTKSGSSINNCIALNASITGTEINRIVSTNSGTLDGNYARPGMDGTWNATGTTGKDGETLVDATFTNVTGASGAFANWSIAGDYDWDLTTANLPTLKGFKRDQPVKDITRIGMIPIFIGGHSELAAFRDAVNSGQTNKGRTVEVTTDITVFDITPWDKGINGFEGTFDGQGHVITMTKATSLFETINEGGIVENLGVNATIAITSNGGSYGGIAMTNKGTIRQCYTVGSITGGNTYAGGIVGTNEGTVKDCYSTVAITVKQSAGGIVQNNKDLATIERCYATGAISGGGNEGVGGIAGNNISSSSITQCIALNASITHAAGSDNLGRIAGTNKGTLTTNYASPLIVGSWNSGLAEKDGAKLTDKNFIDTGSGASAFNGWLPAIWNFGDDAANLPILKGFEGVQPSFTRAQMLPKLTIDNVDELKKFRDAVNDGKTYAGDTVKLTAPITVDAWATGIDGFKGTFNGDGYVITMTNATASLFETINKGSTVQNLGVNATINASVKVGGIAATNKGTIQRCYTEGMITSTQSYSSGIADNSGTIEDCYSTATVTTTGSYAGGIAGGNYEGTIQRCYATGAISSPGSAGIAGAGVSTNSVLNCIALNSSITGTGSNHARIANGSATLTNNYASALIAGEWNNIGANLKDGTDLDDSNFIGTGAGQGAFSNWSETAWNFGDTTKLPILQGFKGTQSVKDSTRASVIPKPLTIATADELKTFRDAVNDGNTFEGKPVILTADITLTGNWTPIGSFDNQFNGTFEGGGHCISGLSVTINKDGDQYGGLFGYIDSKGIVQNLGVKGTVSVISTDAVAYAGGITGYNLGAIQHCYTDVAVTTSAKNSGTTNIGGIAGQNDNKISKCYTMGNSTAVTSAGGIAGKSDKGTIEQCYATGAVKATHTGIGSAGGIVGNSLSGSSYTNCIALNSSIITGEYSGRIASNPNGTFTGNYASPAIAGTWNNKGDDKIDGTDLAEDNFIDTGVGASAFDGWLAAIWDFTDADKLPKLKTTGNIVIAGQGTMPARADFLEKVIEISEPVTYDEAAHNGKQIRVLNGGIFTVATDGASFKKLTIEEGGQVVAQKAFTCIELLAPYTLGNKWTAYGSPVEMKAVAKILQKFYRLSGYKNTGNQSWSSDGSSTTASYPISKLNLIATDATDVSATLTAPVTGNDPVTIPVDGTAMTGSALNTGIFLFCANPTLKNVTIPVAYILSANGTRFERTENAIVKPFQSYVVANAATTASILSLRAGGIPTANEPIALPDNGFRLWGSNGQLYLSADRPCDVTIYDLGGCLIRSITLNGEQTLTLGSGIYLVHSNNITYKVSL